MQRSAKGMQLTADMRSNRILRSIFYCINFEIPKSLYRQLFLLAFYFILELIMTFVVFVGGLLEHQSGKTSIAKILFSYFRNNHSESVLPFKPLSGNNIYYHYEKLKETYSNSKHFISLDVYNLISNYNLSLPAPILNPVNRLNTEAIPYYFHVNHSLKSYYLYYSMSSILLQRFSFPVNQIKNNFKSIYLVNQITFNDKKFYNPKEIILQILDAGSEVKYYSSEHDYYALNSKYYADATNSSFEYSKKHSDIMLIESFNNSAHPAWCVRDSHLILLTGPGSLFVYEPDKYFRAIDSYRSLNRTKPTTTEEIVKMVKPDYTYSLPCDPETKKSDVEKIMSELYPIFSK